MLYIHDYDNWWKFRYDSLRVMNELGRVRSKQGMIIGRMLSLGFDSQDNAVLSNISMELVRSSEIEGEKLNLGEVRSSLARRLGIAMAGMVSASRYVEGVVEMQLDATQNYNHPLSADRLFGWHNVLFPTGISGLYRIEVGKYRSGEITGKWAKIAKCSTDTALNDIRDLVGKGILKKAEEGGRSTNYVMVE